MPDDLTRDPLLSRFSAALRNAYGERLARAVLYGSRARGDFRADSDYDVAVFLREIPNRMQEIQRLAEIETDILFDTGLVINALPFPVEAQNEPTGFMHELRQDGLDL